MSNDETAANKVAHKKELTEKQAQSVKDSDDMFILARRVRGGSPGVP